MSKESKLDWDQDVKSIARTVKSKIKNIRNYQIKHLLDLKGRQLIEAELEFGLTVKVNINQIF